MGEFACTSARGRERARKRAEEILHEIKTQLKVEGQSLQNDWLCLRRELEHLTFCLCFTETLPCYLPGSQPGHSHNPSVAVNHHGRDAAGAPARPFPVSLAPLDLASGWQ